SGRPALRRGGRAARVQPGRRPAQRRRRHRPPPPALREGPVIMNSPHRGTPPNPRADRQFLDDLAGTADDAALDRLRARLAEQAEADGLLDVAYRTMDSPVGPLLLAATPAGLVRVAFECEN